MPRFGNAEQIQCFSRAPSSCAFEERTERQSKHAWVAGVFSMRNPGTMERSALLVVVDRRAARQAGQEGELLITFQWFRGSSLKRRQPPSRSLHYLGSQETPKNREARDQGPAFITCQRNRPSRAKTQRRKEKTSAAHEVSNTRLVHQLPG